MGIDSEDLVQVVEEEGSEDEAPEEMSLSVAKAQVQEAASHEKLAQKSTKGSARKKQKQSKSSVNSLPVIWPDL